MVGLIFAFTFAIDGPHGWSFPNAEINGINVAELHWIMEQVQNMTDRRLPDGYTVIFRPETWHPHDPEIFKLYGDIRVYGITVPKRLLIEVATVNAYDAHEPKTHCAGVTAFGHELLHLLFSDQMHKNPVVFRAPYSYEYRLKLSASHECDLLRVH